MVAFEHLIHILHPRERLDLHWCKPLSRYVEFGDEQNLNFRLLTIEQSGSMDALVVEVMSNLIEDLGEDGTLDEEIPASEVDGVILSKIVDWCTHRWSGQAPAGNEHHGAGRVGSRILQAIDSNSRFLKPAESSEHFTAYRGVMEIYRIVLVQECCP